MRSTIILPLLLAAGAASADVDKVVEGSMPATGATRLALEAGVGKLTVKAGAADVVRWRVELEADVDHSWFSSKRREREVEAALKDAKVGSSLHGDAVELVLDLPRGVDDDDVEERWTVEVPASFAARVGIDVGELKVSGIGGGVRATVDVGSIELDLPRGAIEASVDVGSIDITSAEPPPGDIDLAADVGDVDLELDGRRIRSDGEGYGPGESIRLAGKGGDRVRARVDVGDIEASLGKR